MRCLLFTGRDHNASLQAFAARICDVLRITDVEVRESSNYPGGEYVRCRALGVLLRIARGGDEGLSEYAFSISLTIEGGPFPDHTFVLGLISHIAQVLTSAGFDVAMPRVGAQ